MKTVTLKNGTVEAEVLVNGTLMHLQALLETESFEAQIAFYELVQKVRNPSHQFFNTDCEEYLKARSLLQLNGRVHDSIRNVVDSAVVGEGINLSLESPLAA